MSVTSTIGVAVISAVVTTTVIETAIKPHIEARNRLLAVARDGRAEFSKHVLTILAASGRLGIGRPENDHPARQRLLEERNRWMAQIETSTRELADGIERYALTYVNVRGIAQQAITYGMLTRLIWISSRSVDDRVQRVRELASAVQDVYFARRWWRPIRFWEAQKELTRLIDSYREDESGEA